MIAGILWKLVVPLKMKQQITDLGQKTRIYFSKIQCTTGVDYPLIFMATDLF
jgi:hypothetical protein